MSRVRGKRNGCDATAAHRRRHEFRDKAIADDEFRAHTHSHHEACRNEPAHVGCKGRKYRDRAEEEQVELIRKLFSAEPVAHQLIKAPTARPAKVAEDELGISRHVRHPQLRHAAKTPAISVTSKLSMNSPSPIKNIIR